MQIGIDNFVSYVVEYDTGREIDARTRISHLMEEVQLADASGVDVFGIGEHHRKEFYDSAPTVLLGAAAARTERITLTSAVSVLSADDPVRLHQQFATVDLLSGGRAEMVVGRGSFTEAYPLFGLDIANYDSLFASKLDLLLTILDDPTSVTWAGRHRPPMTGQGVYPLPVQDRLPVWLGVGGSPQSFVRAGSLGLPLMVAIIGGEPRRFRPLIDLYRQAGARAGYTPEQLRVGIHAPGLVADTDSAAIDAVYPGWANMMGTIGRERGFVTPRKADFEQMAGPYGAMFVGSPDTVARKIASVSEDLGGIDRMTIQMTNTQLPHASMLHGIELLGAKVKPIVAELVPV
ncbi:LLM class flavin-dependent oxidoreductase [Rhodococcus sp. 06-462-5]|uniref:LLM class flavin-dependent oxidoreductase n=1 Tax=unclassified Rhodococcus (in: high G+C Gram-positive bacteria) TaxID=192944 RepID=UPI000B9B4B5D|nr:MULTISPECIES: LLM class flavin-dependent oxidoreductase [unclassified Rhodococcus (in: high G+C Gram-positive bacteria)]OZC73602.1 LLM class flavin-dependent oxidoreductase [Rhodococcus sp. 06-462-5]OZE63411.1 LLM class flavin-dependent oxidoreductase [Rhodococcus sp. 02-925g]